MNAIRPSPRSGAPRSGAEHGIVLVSLLALILPLMLVIGSMTIASSARTRRLVEAYQAERALQAAEAGVDQAAFMAVRGTLPFDQDVTGEAGEGASFVVRAHVLDVIGHDDDGDGDVDEPDEDVLRVVSTGTCARAVQRVAVLLGATPPIPEATAALIVLDPSVVVRLAGAAKVDGRNAALDGRRADPAEDVPGISTVAPGSVDHLRSELDKKEANAVSGVSPRPSLALTGPFDPQPILTQALRASDQVLSREHYQNARFGAPTPAAVELTLREGDLKLSGQTSGSGILVVTGDLEVTGGFESRGLRLVLGQLKMTGNSQVLGAVIHGPQGGQLELKGNPNIVWSKDAIRLAESLGSRYAVFNSWRRTGHPYE